MRLLAAAATFLAVGSASLHFLARPHLFTLLLLPACLWLVEADRRQQHALDLAAGPVTAVWTNLHGGFLVFLVLLALLVAGSSIEALLGRPRWSCGAKVRATVAGLLGRVLRQSLGQPDCMSTSSSICARIGSGTWCRSFKLQLFDPKASSSTKCC